MKETNNKALWILSGIIIILILVLLYFFIIQPQIDAYNDEKRIEGINYAVASILQGIQAQGINHFTFKLLFEGTVETSVLLPIEIEITLQEIDDQ